MTDPERSMFAVAVGWAIVLFMALGGLVLFALTRRNDEGSDRVYPSCDPDDSTHERNDS